MSQESYHVVPAPRHGWSVKKMGAHRATRHFETKKSAVEYARELSKSHETDLYIHNLDGRVADRRSYGKDLQATCDL